MVAAPRLGRGDFGRKSSNLFWGTKTKIMTVKQALKEKNKLVVEIKSLHDIAKNYNSIEEGNPRRYSVKESLQKATELTKQLVELKSKIHRANAPVYEKIFLMAELKLRAKQIKVISCEEGKVSERYGSNISIKEVEINIAERDQMVKELELQIEKIQDELDTHNAITHID